MLTKMLKAHYTQALDGYTFHLACAKGTLACAKGTRQLTVEDRLWAGVFAVIADAYYQRCLSVGNIMDGCGISYR